MSKGSISQAERSVPWRIAEVLGIGRVALAQLEALLRARRSFGQDRPRQAQRTVKLAIRNWEFSEQSD